MHQFATEKVRQINQQAKTKGQIKTNKMENKIKFFIRAKQPCIVVG